MCGHCFDNCELQHLDESVILAAKNERRLPVITGGNKHEQAIQSYPPEGMTIEDVQKRIADGIATETDWHYKRVFLAQDSTHNNYEGDSNYFNKGFI